MNIKFYYFLTNIINTCAQLTSNYVGKITVVYTMYIKFYYLPCPGNNTSTNNYQPRALAYNAACC